MASTFSGDNFPFRIAFAVFGSFFTRFDVCSFVFAAFTDVPDNNANWSAADLNPPLRHVSPSSTRRASKVAAAVPSRAIAM